MIGRTQQPLIRRAEVCTVGSNKFWSSIQNLVVNNCHQFKKFPCLIMPMSTKCQKNENKMTINVKQHDDRL
jgi:hypothetical protein